MDDVIPSRHRKKQRNQNPKNDGPTVPDETSKQFSKRELSSNWNKYDDNNLVSNNDSDISYASNFEALLLAPAAIGGHFLFNSEKSWEATDDWYNRDEYFQLNLMELCKSLSTIPFYERQSYSKDIFSVDEIEAMDRQAKYQHFKWSANNSKSDTARWMKESLTDPKSGCNETKNENCLPQNDEDDLDELLTLPGIKQQQNRNLYEITSTTSAVINSVSTQLGQRSSTDNSQDDIQKWLDDVLILDS